MLVHLIILVFATESDAQAASQDEGLRDSCGAYFQGVRTADAQLRNLEAQSIPMVRLGGSPDIALYDRLYKVHQAKISNARTRLRQQESALSGCLANALREKATHLARSKESTHLPKPIVHSNTSRTPASHASPIYYTTPIAPTPTNTPPSRGAPTVR